MCGSTSDTISPSVRSTSRNTPCVLGCWGPMLTSISSVRTSNSMIRGSSNVVVILPPPHPVVFQRHLIVFAERVADPILGTEDPPQVGVPDKADARQVKGFS